MPAQLLPIGTIAFPSFLASGLGVSVAAKIAFAADCLTAPSSAAPPNSHWYYRSKIASVGTYKRMAVLRNRQPCTLCAKRQPSHPKPLRGLQALRIP